MMGDTLKLKSFSITTLLQTEMILKALLLIISKAPVSFLYGSITK